MTARARRTADQGGTDMTSPDTTPDIPDTAPDSDPANVVHVRLLPRVGQWVQYRLSTADVTEINRRRRRSAAAPANQWGFIAPRGNQVSTGQPCAALVVATFGGTTVNLSVQLDGSDTLWVTSRPSGDDPGTWNWPETA